MKTALITGASAGIGFELSKIFTRHHHNLVLVARREDRLLELKKELEESFQIKAHVIPLDLTHSDAPKQLYDELKKQTIAIDILVNNAGFGLQGTFAKTDIDTERNMIELNIQALTGLTKLFLRDMVAKHEGKILNVASTASFLPGPYMSVYYASKAYVLSFSKALAYETRNDGVTISVLCPGPTDTEFQEQAGIAHSNIFSGKMLPVTTAREVAEAGYRGLMKGKTVIIPGLVNKIGAYSSNFSPSFITNRVVEKLHKPE